MTVEAKFVDKYFQHFLITNEIHEDCHRQISLYFQEANKMNVTELKQKILELNNQYNHLFQQIEDSDYNNSDTPNATVLFQQSIIEAELEILQDAIDFHMIVL